MCKVAKEPNRLQAIADAGGLPPLIKVCGSGSMDAKEKAAAALCHLAYEDSNRTFIGTNGGVNPLAHLLAGGTAAAIRYASFALVRLARSDPANQIIIAKCLIAMLENAEADVELRAVRALLQLSREADGSKAIVENGGVSPLVQTITTGHTAESRTGAAALLQTLADSDDEHHAEIAVATTDVRTP